MGRGQGSDFWKETDGEKKQKETRVKEAKCDQRAYGDTKAECFASSPNRI